MSVKDCGKHKDKKKELLKKIGIGVGIFVLVLLLLALILWLVLRPASKPVFLLQDATVHTFNLTGYPPNFITSTFQLTVQCRNPNGRISIYYDSLMVYATYRTQQITAPTSFPPTYQDTNGINVWSPYVTGVLVPIAPYVGQAISQDQTAGNILINFQMNGRLRWKVGAFVSATYNLHVNCPAYITVANSNAGAVVGYHAVKYQLSQTCSVSL
ncbi:uncharacterized protein [Phyllobates terribilis]|uniref:uncharacterized protein n=1 Tax=Phyllobates terribilis TaxID=111132 RepID=UPI003CCAAB29